MSPLVSICIPTYKQTALLKQNLDSICAQTYKNVEVLVSDDTNDDTVFELVKQYQHSLPLNYHRNVPSLGSPANWNAVLRKAKGDFIILLHHDDHFALATSLQEFLQPFFKDQADFVFGRNETIDYLTKTEGFKPSHLTRLYANPALLVAHNYLGAPSNVMFRREAVEYYDEKLKWIVDVELYTRLFEKKKQHFFVNKLLVKTGRHEGQITNLCLEDSAIQIYENLYYANKHIKKVNDVKVFDFYWRLLRNNSVRSIDDLQKAGLKDNEIPHFIRRMLAVQRRLPQFLLKSRPVSKLTMALTFILSRS